MTARDINEGRFINRRVGTMLLLGFSSGLPLALTGGTLQAWLTVSGLDLPTIGLFSLVGLPYSLKFLWAPAMDRFVPPWLGRRRGWLAATQFALLPVIASLGFIAPDRAPMALAVIVLILAFLSASQDVVFDAYRADVLHANERGVGAGMSVFGYRIAMLTSGAVALILADHVGWRITFWLMAGLMGVGIGASLWAPEPIRGAPPPATLREAVAGPLRDFFGRRQALLILAFVVLYKFGDAFAGTLTTAFLLRGAGFSLTEVGTVNKGFGILAVIFGAVAGGAIMARLGLYRSLMMFGVLQAVSNLMFMVLAWTEKNYGLMVAAVGIENFAGGMGTVAFVALLMALCTPKFTATQYALLSAVAAVGRLYLGPVAGFLVERIGWAAFFLATTGAAVPGLLVLVALREQIKTLGATAEPRGPNVRPTASGHRT